MNSLTDAVVYALDEANWTLPDNITNIEGLFGPNSKRFMNALVSNPNVKRYLEIGAWEGSSTIASLYGNHQRLDK